MLKEIQPIPKDFTPADKFLEDKVILVTGAAGAIGSAVARACAQFGAVLVLLDKNVKGLETCYDEIISARGKTPAIYPLDLIGASEKDYHDMAITIQNELGRLDAVIHCAAQLGALIPLEHFETELWLKIMHSNLNAPFLLTRACLPLLKQQQASIIFTTDKTGRQGKAYWGAYAVANAGLENLVQVMADELQGNTNINVCSLDPGEIRSALHALAYPGKTANTLTDANDISYAYLYLLSEAGRRYSGQPFAV